MNAWAKHFIKTSKGFTIIELLIVLVVIALLAVILFVGYGAVQNSAHDKSVQSDLNKFADIMSLYSLDYDKFPGGDMPSVIGSYNFKTSFDSYAVAPVATYNLNYCYITGNTDTYGLVAKSVSGKAFYVTDSSGGVKDYTGPWPSDVTGQDLCTALNPAFNNNVRGYASTDTITGPWRAWTGATFAQIITNMVTNPSFSTSASGWTNGGYGTGGVASSTRTAGIGPNGGYAMRSVWTTAASSSGHSSQIVVSGANLVNGQDYTASCWARTNQSVSSGRVRVLANSVTYNGPYQTLPANTYTRLSTTFTATNDATSYTISCRIDSLAGTTDGFTFDSTNYMLTSGAQLYTYADGDSPGWTWNGTPGGSTSTGPEL